MKRTVKAARLFSLFLLLFCLVTGMRTAAFARAGGPMAVVADEADLMTWDEENALQEALEKLRDRYGYDFLAVTCADAKGMSSMRYAEQSSLTYGGAEDGVVYLIDMDNRELYIATYGHMEYVLSDSRIESLLDSGYGYLTQGAYADCFSAMIRSTSRYLEQGVPSGAYTYNTDNGETAYYEPPKTVTSFEGLIAAVIGLIAGGGFFASVSGRYNMKSGNYRYDVGKNGKLNLTARRDRLLHRNVQRHRIYTQSHSSGSGGHGGSGSSIHFGGGGRTYGGGGRKF